ncbi:hypothetical protein F2P56_013035 [Juglans regia]|uniref:Uncharacterized protein n=1 Tax=Juglans regia TaxID=51240 RepID=A0A833XNL8_JUGRE|nr:hypothetical protein F2P56_013035 [Juglans regia]
MYIVQLLWVVLIGLVFALIIQSLAANLGVSIGKHLSELWKAEYPKYVKYCLWLLAEAAVIAADIPEVIGTAFGLNILFHIPMWAGVLLTGLSTLLLLGLQRYGHQGYQTGLQGEQGTQGPAEGWAQSKLVPMWMVPSYEVVSWMAESSKAEKRVLEDAQHSKGEV